ncbi:4Fe-4S binding protein [Nonomuraea typhae]|uniref:4Fe-4S binding protein n=1 Tax=Nonomuraea typhae TaxID=2603600 RepID=UPI0031B6130A
MLRRSVTQQYPEVKPALPPRSRGVIALVEENCTSCMLCARECPDWCIYIDSHKETLPAPEGGRPRQRNVLDRFAIDFALCMYCGICIEVCPFDALFWSPEFEYAEGDIRNLLHEKEQLQAWVQTVPPPPGHDPGAEPPKETTAGPRRPARASGTAEPSDAPAARPPRAPGAQRRGAGAGSAAAQTGASDGEGAGAGEGGPSAAAPADKSPQTPSPQTPEGQTPEGQTPPAQTPSAQTPEGQAPPAQTPSAQTLPAQTPTGETPTAETPTAQDPAGESADAPSGPDAPRRPRRAVTNVRGIRPPGSLPDAGRTPEPPAAEGEPPAPEELSTGESGPGQLSTGSGEPSKLPETEEHNSSASPRRRRMADPRSIRPPGRLPSDETQESEEDS